ncbi:uncharacterized protein TNCV_2142091 [Trichonephila clavipes]|uniref:RNase H type-1 domain-containing protein n=1 Tax=Trichonephila clavipes TaxID=2585209 RepID=A0A8X6V1A1_TRICX|nr:uncharacterized protein TNCV_2142091 [Trichonephila clavipes]
MDSTGLDILSKLVRLGQRKEVCLQWITSHVGVHGNEAADEMATKSPGLSIQCRSFRTHQTVLARFRSGHLRSMTFVQGVKSFFTCPCSLLASPAHLLDCWGISLPQLYEEQGLKDFLCLDNEHIFDGDQGYTPEIMDEILTTARDLELEVNEDDIEELIMGYEDDRRIPRNFE